MRKRYARILVMIIGMVLIHQLMVHETRACNVAVVTAEASSTGRPFLWKNRDNAESYKQEIKYYPQVVSGVGGSLRLMGETTYDSGVSVCTGGANASGFAIANTTCYESVTLEASNVNTELIETALEECQTLANFEQIASEFTSRWSNKNISGIFGVIDAHDGAAIYEMWTDGNGNDIMYRKFDAHTGNVTDENGDSFTNIKYTQTLGFNNRTNSNHTNGWIDIWSDTPRELRARQLMTEMLANDELSPRNMMRLVSKDVCGGNPADYCSTETSVMNSWNGDNSDDDSYLNPNRDGEMYVRYCISRYQTSMGLVVEGASAPAQANLTTMWVSLGEPSLSVFVPYFPAAGAVSKYATDDSHSNSGYYWDGTSSTEDSEDNSFLNLIFDCVEANPFSSSHELYNTYRNLALYKNNGSGNFIDSQDRNDGEYYSYLTGTRKMDTTITYPRLVTLQNWTLPLEDSVFDHAGEFLSVLRSNTGLVTAAELAGFSNYCNRYVYQNYSHQSYEYMAWDRALPDNGEAPEVSSISIHGVTDFPIDGTISVQFSESIDEDTIDETTFTVSGVSGDVTYDPATLTATFTPDEPLTCNMDYTVVLDGAITDLAGIQMGSDTTDTFTTAACVSTDTTAPTVSSAYPHNAGTRFPVSDNISVTFSEAMDDSTITEDTFQLFVNGSSVPVAGTVTYYPSTHTAMLNPAANLAVNTAYKVELSGDMTDVAGNHLADYSLTFTTTTVDSTVDTDPPTIMSVNPVNRTEDVPLTRNIIVQFSEEMDESTINSGTFTLYEGSIAVPGSVTYDAASYIAIFDPDSDLIEGVQFTVEISSSISDAAGNALRDGYSWSFVSYDDPGQDDYGRQNSDSGSGDGCGSAAEASTFAGGARPVMPGVMSLAVTMLFPLSLMALHRRARGKNSARED